MSLFPVRQVSGLSDEIGKFLSTFGTLPRPVITLLVSTVTVIVTQITSNISTTTIFLPIVASLVRLQHLTMALFIIIIKLYFRPQPIDKKNIQLQLGKICTIVSKISIISVKTEKGLHVSGSPCTHFSF